MNVHPNQTVVNALVTNVTPAEGGYGHGLDLEILANESPDPAADFLQPKAGDRLKVFTANLGDLTDGQQIQATIALVGGPSSQQAILRKAVKITP